MKFKFNICGSNCFSSSSSVSKPPINTIKSSGKNTHENLQIFSFQELNMATHNFAPSNKVGEGAFGLVYKGRLADGSMVAVKVLSIEMGSMRGEREFISELAALSNINHQNLVKLQGCCVDGSNRYLVYDYMQNNSLAHTLLGKEQNRIKFNWEARRNVAIGVARAVAYLHEEVNPHILHRDIKASNILLDNQFIPKVADFGLSRLLRDGISHVSTRVAGTLGYLAPEYAVSGRMTRKSDVYSYGVLLTEIVSGRSAVDFNLELGEHYLVQKPFESRDSASILVITWEAYKNKKLIQIIDPALDMNFPEEEATRFLMVSLLCVQETAKLRPQMSTCLKMMINEIDITRSSESDTEITKPGLVCNFKDIKLHHNKPHTTFETSSSSRDANTSMSLTSTDFSFH